MNNGNISKKINDSNKSKFPINIKVSKFKYIIRKNNELIN